MKSIYNFPELFMLPHIGNYVLLQRLTLEINRYSGRETEVPQVCHIPVDILKITERIDSQFQFKGYFSSLTRNKFQKYHDQITISIIKTRKVMGFHHLYKRFIENLGIWSSRALIRDYWELMPEMADYSSNYPVGKLRSFN
jgi:hypothetical protein